MSNSPNPLKYSTYVDKQFEYATWNSNLKQDLPCNNVGRFVIFQDQKVALKDERRQLHRAIEKQHRYLMAEKAKMAIFKRLASKDPRTTEITWTPCLETDNLLKPRETKRQSGIASLLEVRFYFKIRVRNLGKKP